jgi:hypothetical protein
MRDIFTLTLFLAVTPAVAHAQEAAACQDVAGGTVVTSQPRIVAIPFTRQGEDLRTILEENLGRRIAVTKVQQALDERGFSSTDFLGAIRVASVIEGWETMSQTDIKSAILDRARADIYIELETEIETRSTGSHAAVVIMRGFLSANGMSLGNRVGRSQWSQASETQLIEKAIELESEPLLAMMQEKFDGFFADGVPIQLNVSAREGAENDLETWVGDLTVGDIVEEWVADHAWKDQYDVTALTAKRMFFAEVRIPMRDPQTCRNYTPLRFGQLLRRHLAQSRIRSTVTLTNGNVFIELR